VGRGGVLHPQEQDRRAADSPGGGRAGGQQPKMQQRKKEGKRRGRRSRVDQLPHAGTGGGGVRSKRVQKAEYGVPANGDWLKTKPKEHRHSLEEGEGGMMGSSRSERGMILRRRERTSDQNVEVPGEE